MRFLFIATLLFSFQLSNSQIFQMPNANGYMLRVKAADTIPKWDLKHRVGLDINEVTFVNWNAGGSNSISALMGIRSELNYKYGLFKWKSQAIVNYGINKQQEQELRKTSDELELISTVGFQKDSESNWFFSSRFNFKTQFTNGYNYPNRSTPISRFMAPGYLFIGGGVEYGKNIDKFSTYFSPLTFKSTFVLDKDLSNAGSFGVRKAVVDSEGNIIKQGERVRTEIGMLLTNEFETKVFDNVLVRNRASFYSDYINSFGNIDVDWEVIFNFKVNQYVKATLGSHVRYDNDVKTFAEVENEEEELVMEGAKIQWKQLLGIGVVVDF
ncbi:DUF3078 domain-containing protein [Subsaxibacter sp. CAU 1640]|uniref:DUF3078 domain-containing protein n=1 Tax=Subsaxibacter sp. CAU 1640 TaxID=2933271 RepID=UPI0020034E3E|nr:DUF3078 domain-containing protein [Subsaxibacter sp. CAU 1640]MCK7591395.1 DUF3078 domain-containing protein [Subsaxibacter sp. CAU 1640]